MGMGYLPDQPRLGMHRPPSSGTSNFPSGVERQTSTSEAGRRSSMSSTTSMSSSSETYSATEEEVASTKSRGNKHEEGGAVGVLVENNAVEQRPMNAR